MRMRHVTGTLLVALALAACGDADPRQQPQAAGPCQASQDAVPGDRSVNDDPKASGGTSSFGLSSGAAGSTDELLAQTRHVAVLEVVGRDLPVARSGPGYPNAVTIGGSYPRGDESDSSVRDIVRPVRFRVTRVLKGTLPECLALDVPGGRAGTHRSLVDTMPRVITPGDTVLAFLDDEMGGVRVPLYATELLKAAKDGTVRLPFGSQPVVDLDTWTLSDEARTPPTRPAAGSCDDAGNCAPPAP
jgi:hypothetical protein